MASPFTPPLSPPVFVGREAELAWLERELSGRDSFMRAPIAVVAPAGIGKTALVSAFFGDFFETRKRKREAAWIQCRTFADVRETFDEFMRGMRPARERIAVVLDGADDIPEKQFVSLMGHVMNYKLVGSIIITKRDEAYIRKARILRLGPLDTSNAERLFSGDLARQDRTVAKESLGKLLAVAQGHPLALTLLARLAGSLKRDELLRTLEGQIYGPANFPTVTRSELITVVQPTIITATEVMISALKKQPQSVMNLSSRQFEELVAELLRDMGWDVELTPATRDGGKDILAYLKTDVGKFLCLVEAKRYRGDRKIGVELVRTLYGTLADYQANSAMMVTTSSFSKDARALEKRHEFQLALRDYTDVVGWIMKHGRRRGE